MLWTYLATAYLAIATLAAALEVATLAIVATSEQVRDKVAQSAAYNAMLMARSREELEAGTRENVRLMFAGMIAVLLVVSFWNGLTWPAQVMKLRRHLMAAVRIIRDEER